MSKWVAILGILIAILLILAFLYPTARYQAVSHNGYLYRIDTRTGEVIMLVPGTRGKDIIMVPASER